METLKLFDLNLSEFFYRHSSTECICVPWWSGKPQTVTDRARKKTKKKEKEICLSALQWHR